MGHHVPDRLLATESLKQRLFEEAGFENDGLCPFAWYSIPFCESDKAWSIGTGYCPEPAERLMAESLGRILNRQLHHDGAWITGWTDDGRRFVSIWVDADGDVQFTVDCLDGVVKMAIAGAEDHVEQCEQAWQKWHRHMRQVIAPREDQLFKRAQGQRAPSAR